MTPPRGPAPPPLGRRPAEPRWRRYLRFWKSDLDADLDDEIRFHVEMRERDYLARGLSPEEAARAAAARFGDVQQVRSLCRDIDTQTEREIRMIDRLGTFHQDVRYALRGLRRSPGFAVVAVLSLGLGIGANTAIFRLADALFLRTTPGITDPERVYAIANWKDGSYPSYMDLAEETRSVFSGLAAFREREFSLGTSTTPLRLTGAVVTGNFFEVMGVPMALGRPIVPEDDRRGEGRPVVVLSHGLWERAFGGDSTIVGRELLLNERPMTVIGVAAPEFRGTTLVMPPEFWIPVNSWRRVVAGALAGLDIERRLWGWIRVAGRLAPGVTPAQAEESVRAAARGIQEAHFPRSPDWAEISIEPLAAAVRASTGGWSDQFIPLLAGIVGLALLVACVNLAILLLARATQRRREFGIRLALGASRGRLVRQLLTESVILALCGGVAAIIIALWMTRSLVGQIPQDVTTAVTGGLTARAIGFAGLLALLTVLLFGLLPALRAARLDPRSSLQDGEATSRTGKVGARSVLVVAQIAVSVAMLAGAGMFVRSLQRAVRIDTGYDIDRIAVTRIDLGLQRYDTLRAIRFYADLARRLDVIPGVRASTYAWTLPLTGNENRNTLRTVDGTDTANVAVSGNIVGARFFEAVGLRLAHGRDFTDRDALGAERVVVVNERFARRFWPNDDAIGRQVVLSGQPPMTVVGVARDAKYASLEEEPAPHFYAPLAQNSRFAGLDAMTILVGTSGDPSAILDDVRREIRALDPALPIFNVGTTSDVLGVVLLPQRVAAMLLGLFGVLALVLVAIGIYGVVAYAVSQRRREIGLRVALGARGSDVIALMLGRMMVLIAVGIALGAGLAIAGSRSISAFLVGMDGGDPVAFAGAILLLAAVALVASWLPARRATRVDPVIALRAE